MSAAFFSLHMIVLMADAPDLVQRVVLLHALARENNQ